MLPFLRRCFSTDKHYSSSLLLPKSLFPLRPALNSDAQYRLRTCDDLYNWQHTRPRPRFVFLDGPPYANGNLHIGHALNKILKDIVNRFHVLQGYRVHYVPGWDCHGLPIENKALQGLKGLTELNPRHIRQKARQVAHEQVAVQMAEFRKFGIMADWDNTTYKTMDHAYEMRQLRVFHALVEKGLIYRQNRPVYYSPSSRTALAEAELIYTDHTSSAVYLTYECDCSTLPPHIQHALSGASCKLVVWTTTPWTLPANMGIAVNSHMDYSLVRREDDAFIVASELVHSVLGEHVQVLHTFKGSSLQHVKYTPHFTRNALPVIQSPHVTATSGTGLVHCAPAHGVEDYQAFLAQGLLSSSQPLCFVNGQAKFSAELMQPWVDSAVQERLADKEVLKEGNKEVLRMLEERASVLRVDEYKHRYPYDWKTNKPVILLATPQWFADLSRIKDDALRVLKSVHFHPSAARTRLESYVLDRSEWCISRQRAWGVPIPALHNDLTPGAFLTPQSLDHIIQTLDAKGAEYWWDGPVDEFVHPELAARFPGAVWSKGTDTMDVWFDSGTAWTHLAGEKAEVEADSITEIDGQRVRTISNVVLEGTDQHRGWFQSLLLTAVGVSSGQDTLVRPYERVVTHGFVLDKHGRKMSKSLGNVISPMTIVEGGANLKKDPAYGADVLRLWAATIDYGKDTLLGQELIQQTNETVRKVRNSARFALGNLATVRPEELKVPPEEMMSIADRYMMHELHQFEKTAKEAYTAFQFPQVVIALDRLAKVTLSSFYFDITKDVLYADAKDAPRRQTVLWVMHEILQTMNMVMAPILPHLSEEVHDVLQKQWGKTEVNSVFRQGWCVIGPEWHNPTVEKKMKRLLGVRDKVLVLLERARADKLIRSSLEAGVDIILPDNVGNGDNVVQALFDEETYLPTLFIVSDTSLLDEGSLGSSAREWSISDTVEIEQGSDDDMIHIRVRPAKGVKCPRCWTYTRSEEEKLCQRCEEVVG